MNESSNRETAAQQVRGQKQDSGQADSKQTSDPAIRIESVSKSFGSQRVLDGVSFNVNAGETLAVLGRSGTGKSVLLRAITGLQNADSGSVIILGTNMAEAPKKEINAVRIRMGFLFQNAALYDSMSVAQNVAFPLTHHRNVSAQERDQRVEELLE